ncbi:zinc-finger homeodomain protein 6-like [Camellia sinensis]|uniref:zinc-finger homeodomain protein 6-like n=1 Tax=Camellia sinensis TaxID=4442 RepID=UPI0010360C86|nr:zinc-finger homeodomain protein 6-like [Camellia sinensis]
MELRGQDKDMGISIGYSTTTTAAVTGRRRNDHHQSTVLNPTQQTLDHHLHQQLNLHQQTHVEGRDPNPDPDPDPTPSPSPSPSPTIARASNSKTPPPPQPPPPPSLEANSGSSASFRYRECLKNHAANMGCHVVDGCGEFMPSGEEGTPEELKCAACDCHRNFHRKEIEGEFQQPGTNSYYPYNPNRNTTHRTTTTTHLPQPLPPPPPPHHHHHHHRYAPPTGPFQPVMMAFGGGVAAESSSEDLNNMVFHCNDGTQPPMGIVQQPFTGSKKRFRTKFSQEQKDRMQQFAERLEWKIQKQDEEQVQQFCGEVGVKRQVFKVWMHNNKQAMKKKQL